MKKILPAMILGYALVGCQPNEQLPVPTREPRQQVPIVKELPAQATPAATRPAPPAAMPADEAASDWNELQHQVLNPVEEVKALVDTPVLPDPVIETPPAPTLARQPAPDTEVTPVLKPAAHKTEHYVSRGQSRPWLAPAAPQVDIAPEPTVNAPSAVARPQPSNDSVWIKRAEGYRLAKHPMPELAAGCDVAVRGRLLTGALAPGGETTGVLIKTPEVTWELDLSTKPGLARAASSNDGRMVVVTGHVRNHQGKHVSRRTIMRVARMKLE